jgi:Domain of unknown function (DUF4407)
VYWSGYLFTALFACLLGGYAMYFVFSVTTAAVILGIIWALAVFNMNVFIVSSISNAGTTKEEVLQGTPHRETGHWVSYPLRKMEQGIWITIWQCRSSAFYLSFFNVYLILLN